MLLRTLITFTSIVHLALVLTSQWTKVRSCGSYESQDRCTLIVIYYNNYLMKYKFLHAHCANEFSLVLVDA